MLRVRYWTTDRPIDSEQKSLVVKKGERRKKEEKNRRKTRYWCTLHIMSWSGCRVCFRSSATRGYRKQLVQLSYIGTAQQDCLRSEPPTLDSTKSSVFFVWFISTKRTKITPSSCPIVEWKDFVEKIDRPIKCIILRIGIRQWTASALSGSTKTVLERPVFVFLWYNWTT